MIDPHRLPKIRGKWLLGEALAPFTWFRVGGPAEALCLPEDEADLSEALARLPEDISVLTIGVGSNLLIRDGGVEGVVVRLGRGFHQIEVREGGRLYAGAAALDAQVAKRAAKEGIGGLEFLRGVPGTIGGAIVMNAGCYGRETKDVLVEAYALDRQGKAHVFSARDMDFSYRHSMAHEHTELVFTGALFQGVPEAVDVVTARMEAITQRREQSQPIREKTGGSTFKNPEGKSAWQCVDETGWRGKRFGGAQFSELHSNFMINADNATAADLEGLGEAVRADVLQKLGIELQWEIKRLGRLKS